MSKSQSQKLFGTTNELAKERNRAAAERTINSWIGTCLSLISIGVAIDQIYRSLSQRFPSGGPLGTETTARITSMVFIGVGLALLAIALLQHRLSIKTIEREDCVLLLVTDLNRLVVAGVVMTGFLGIFAIIFLL